ncbi:FadR/GntR family transcriptional regulator [Ruthenibacterium sp. CLA-JM-H11]|uniref:FadR/GntR family transcriptional regulator n=1 Tax=Ruthenibacterium intestinale TaxID=3133163 RepID=A0ABV1GJ22_9FIRM
METKTLAHSTAEKLVQYIREQQLAPGAKIPTEYELARMLGVGRNTLREAVRMLASRNILEIRQGAGTFVCEKMGVSDDPLGFTLVSDRRRLTDELMEIRCIIEPSIAALAARNATEQELTELEQACAAVEQCIREGQDFTAADQVFHTIIARCTHNSVMSNLIPVITRGVSVYASETEQECVQTVRSHRRILQAIRLRHEADAQQAMLYHLLYNSYRRTKDSDSV